MGRNLGGWLVIGVFVFALAKCGETKTPSPSLHATSPPVAVTHEFAKTPSPPSPVIAVAKSSSTATASVPLEQPRRLIPEPSLSRQPAKPEAILRPIKRSLYVTGKEVPMRAAPDGKAAILDRLPTGMEVGELTRREGWVEVRHPISAVEGWMSTRRLTTKAPANANNEKPAKISPDLKTTSAPFDTTVIAAALIARSIASYSGNCPCPHNVDRAGRRCGGRSAHSRGGGRAPLCYPSDITPAMIANYRARGGR